jgi:serine/threonine-protein kinase
MATPGTIKTTKKQPSILFVDDDPSILTIVKLIFRANYNITVTADPFEAVELLKTKKFDVIVSDQRMPTMTGVELLRQARDLAPNTIRILLTGYADTDAIVGAINDVEVYRFLQKPWDNERLKRIIDEAVLLANIVDEAATATDNTTDASLDFADLAPKQPANATSSPIEDRKHPAANVTSSSTLATGTAAPSDSGKELVLVTDAKSTLFTQIQSEMAGKVDMVHTTDILKVFDILESMPVSIMICSFDMQSKSDRRFLQGMKQAYPQILVIAICDSSDSAYLIELINQAKIFRFVKKPVSIPLLEYHIMSAVAMAEALRNMPFLIRSQQTEVLE